ncbi:MAG TPA: ATP-binding protein [Chitinophagaceae bacterium]|nr:ATP-binding protein [Chitinophagaceae bacterium]
MNPSFSNNLLVIITGTVLLVMLLAFIGALLLQHRRREQGYLLCLAQYQQQADRQLLQAQIEMQEQTFQEIARELHDNIGLSLTLARLQLRLLQEDSANSNALVAGVNDIIGKAVADLRDISSGLNTDSIRSEGLYHAVRQLGEKLQRSGNYAVQISVSGDIVFLEASTELIVFRMLQEAVNNILKHAAATAIAISLFYESSRLCIVVNDNGCGFNPQQQNDDDRRRGPRSGLRNMQARALALRGSFFVESRPGGGTRVVFSLPIQ